jgi:putative two-component system response regulator
LAGQAAPLRIHSPLVLPIRRGVLEQEAGKTRLGTVKKGVGRQGSVAYPLPPRVTLAPNGGGTHTLAEGGYVLVVDDEPQVQQLIARILERNGFRCELAASADEARELLESRTESFQLMLCDVNMPGESGLELLSSTLATHPEVAALMVTGADDPEMAENAIKLGAFGYLTKPFRPNELMINIVNALHRRRLELENRAHKAMLENAVEARTAALSEAVSRLQRSEQELRTHQEETVRRLSSMAELRDLETGRHLERMSSYCELLAERFDFPRERVELMRIASPMHDVGKIGIPDNILLKPSTLTPEEREVMQQHTVIGYRILSGSDAELLTLAAMLAWTHHERFDGSGYPRQRVGEEIPLEGRIAAVADVFDALTSDRIYRPAFDVEEAVTMMREQRGTHFDPEVLDRFLDAMDKVEEIRIGYKNQAASSFDPSGCKG